MKHITMQPIWDADYLKDCEQAGLERMKNAQFEQDWKRAETEAVRRVSNAVEHHFVCRSARCRRARRCVSNKAPCKHLSKHELKPEEMQRLVEKVYLRIQQEHRAAADDAAKADRHGPARRGDPVIRNADETRRAQQPISFSGLLSSRGRR